MRILVIDDEESMRHMLSVILKKEGYDVSSCADALSALKVLEKDDFDFILSDIKMPKLDGLGFLKKLKPVENRATVIMMSAYGTVDNAIECMKLGAYDYISKPFKADEILLTIRKATEREKLKRENLRLKRESAKQGDISNIYAADPVMLKLLEFVRKVADYDTTVLVTGETGTGKELVARALHHSSKRADAPFVAVNCGAIPENLLESELFGHVKGAFTDAVRSKDGLFQEADGGTLLLDEVGDLPKELQVKLLRVLQEGEVRKVGDTRSQKVNVRVVSATIKNLEEEAKAGAFREDLFYRLNVIPIKMPPLRERPGDIEGLADLFLKRYSEKFSKTINGFTEEAGVLLHSYRWPGNVRELENIIERAVILEDTDMLRAENLPVAQSGSTEGGAAAAIPGMPFQTLSIKKAQEFVEKTLIKKALDKTGGNKTRAAEFLEISHRTLVYKIKDYGL